MAQFVNKLRDCMRTVNLTMLLVLNLFFIVTLNLTVATVLVVLISMICIFVRYF